MSDLSCDRLDDAAAWVLGMLPAEEAAEFEQHVADCPVCREDARRLDETAVGLAVALEPVAPSDDLRAAVIGLAAREAALLQAVASSAEPQRPRDRARRAAVAVAAAGLVAAGFAGGLLAGSGDDPATATVVGEVTPAGGGERARATVVRSAGSAQLVLRGVRPAPAGRLYQAWVVRDDGRIVATDRLFSVPPDGDTRISLPPLDGVRRVIVTAEPRTGSDQPTTRAVATIRLPAGLAES